VVDNQNIRDKIKQAQVLVIYFSYPECSVCRVLRPKVEALVAELPGIDFLYVNTHQHPEVSGQYLVFAVPTILVFSDGKEVKRFSRHFSLQELETFLRRLLELRGE